MWEPKFIGGEVDLRINIYRGQIEVNDLKCDLDKTKTDLKARLIEVIRWNPDMTYKALGEELSVSVATIKRTLAKLQQEGKVVREGSNRKGKWVLTDKR